MIFRILLPLQLVWLRASLAASDYGLERPYPEKNESDSRTSLYFSLIQSFSGQYISSFSLPGLQLALDLINGDENLLPGYVLHFVLTDAECDQVSALEAFHRQVFEPPTKIGIIGSGCSVSTEPTASISHYYNLVQVSCIASSPAFRNRRLFPRYFQLLPTDASLAVAYFGIIRHYDWQRIAIIVQPENLFTVAMDELKVMLDDNNVDYSETELVINENGIPGGPLNASIEGLSDVFDEDSRIFIISTYEPHAREIICEAQRRGYKYPQYVFFLIPWYIDRWWAVDPDSYGCDVAERESVLEFSITVMNLPFSFFLDPSMDTDTGGGLTVGEYYRREKRYLDVPPLNVSMADFVAPVCYDAMWSLALAINSTITDLETNLTLSDRAHEAENMTLRSTPFRLEHFSYNNNIVMETMFKHMNNTDFVGVSGDVIFNELGIRQVTQYLILQFRKNSSNNNLENEVQGRWSEAEGIVYSPGTDVDDTWPLGVPYDGVSVNEDVLSVHLSLTIILIFLSACGIIFSAVCLAFNFYYRNQTLVRLTSPNLNYLIGSGAILLYTAIIVTVIPATSYTFASVLCNLQVWLTGFGYSLCYGTILVKMWRVYYIFSNPSALKKANLHDWKLALMVGCFVVIDLVMLVVFSAVEGARGELGARKVLDKENAAIMEGEQDRIREFYVYICHSTERHTFLGIFYGYKALLQLCGLFLAFATRKVKIKGIDDAKWIAATIYITSIVLAITILALYTLSEYVNRHSALFTGGLLIGTTFIMGFVFVSKMYALYKDPQGKKVFDKSRPTDRSSDRPPNSHADALEHGGKRATFDDFEKDSRGT